MNRPIFLARSAKGLGRPATPDGLAIGGSDCPHPVISVEFWLRLRGHIRLNQHAHLRRGSGAGPGPRGGEQSDPPLGRGDAGQGHVSAGGRSAMSQRSGWIVASGLGRRCRIACPDFGGGWAWPGADSGRGPVVMVTATGRSRSGRWAKSAEGDGCADMRTGGHAWAAVPTGKFLIGGGCLDPGRGPVAGRRVARPGAPEGGSLVPPPWGPDPLRSRRPVALVACPSRTREGPC